MPTSQLGRFLLDHIDSVSSPHLLDALRIGCGVASSSDHLVEAWLRWTHIGIEWATSDLEREFFQLSAAVAMNRMGQRDRAYAIFDDLIDHSADPGMRASALIGKLQFEPVENAWRLAEEAMTLVPIDALRFYDESVALHFLGEATRAAGHYSSAAEMFQRDLEYTERAGWTVMYVHAAAALARLQAAQGDLEDAEATVTAALPVARRIIGAAGTTAWALVVAGGIARGSGDLDRAQALVEESERVASIRSLPAMPQAIQAGLIARDRGEDSIAVRLLAEAQKRAERSEQLFAVAYIRALEASAAIRRSDPRHALDCVAEALTGGLDHLEMLDAIDVAATALRQLGHLEEAARLLGAADAERARTGVVVSPPDQPNRSETVLSLRDYFGDRFDALVSEGTVMTLDDAVAYVLDRAAEIAKAAP